MSVFNKSKGTTSKGGDLFTAVDRVVKGKITYTKSTLNLIKKYGDKTIVGLIVKRKPISVSAVINLAKIVSKTLAKTFKSRPFDMLYHLYIEIRLEGGTTLILEKNSVITLSKTTRTAEEQFAIQNVPTNLTINQMLTKTQNKMRNNFHTYDAVKSNCQDFLLAVLTSNGILEGKDFIKQDISGLIGSVIQKSIKTLTEIGGVTTTLFD